MKKLFGYFILSLLIINFFASDTAVFSYEYEDPNNERLVENTKQDIYDITQEYYDLFGKNKENVMYQSYSNKYWWPIGSVETTEENGVLFAKGDPETTHISSYFGQRDLGNHYGLDIDGGRTGETNIIASKSGVVIYPTSADQIHFPTGYLGNGTDGGGYGNYVMIQHSNGDVTVYAHLYQDSITVFAGDTVSQGQVIGKMGSSGNSTGTHLHFEIRVNQQQVDPLTYISAEEPRPASGGAFPLFFTSLSRDEYVHLATDYLNKVGKGDSYFAKNAGEIYDLSLKYEVNPELVLITALGENGVYARSDNNHWGVGCPNSGGCKSYSSFEEGLADYAGTYHGYNTQQWAVNTINARAQEREATGCNPMGYGTPDSLSGIQSLYSSIGEFRLNPGTWGAGGCKYLNHYIFEDNYCSTVPTCDEGSGYYIDSNKKVHTENCPESSRTTVVEQCEYTAYQVKSKYNARFDIFGL